MKDIGELKYFLEMQVHWNWEEWQVHINQSGYIESILNKFKFFESNPVSTPIATYTILYQSNDNDVVENPKKYQSLIGSRDICNTLYKARFDIYNQSNFTIQ